MKYYKLFLCIAIILCMNQAHSQLFDFLEMGEKKSPIPLKIESNPGSLSSIEDVFHQTSNLVSTQSDLLSKIDKEQTERIDAEKKSIDSLKNNIKEITNDYHKIEQQATKVSLSLQKAGNIEDLEKDLAELGKSNHVLENLIHKVDNLTKDVQSIVKQ